MMRTTSGSVTRSLGTRRRCGSSGGQGSRDAACGGYEGYLADPDGDLWELAWGAFELNEVGHSKSRDHGPAARHVATTWGTKPRPRGWGVAS